MKKEMHKAYNWPEKGGGASLVHQKLLKMAAYAAPAIMTFQGTVLAQSQKPNDESVHILATPALTTAGLAALGTGLATVAGYKLLKARKRDTKHGGEKQSE